MKNVIYFLLIFIVAIFTSCKKELDSEGVSKITIYPTLNMLGDQEILVPLGTTFTDPGITAFAGTVSLPVTTSVSGIFSNYSGTSIDATAANKYEITYSAKNSDGFAGSLTRDVYVAKTGDLVNSIEGLYSSTVVRSKVVSPQYQDLHYVLIWKTGANTYAISDGIGGYYAIGRNYGPAFMATGGTITANNIATNSFSFSGNCVIAGFGPPAVEFNSLAVDPIAKTLTLKTGWQATATTHYDFVITLTQVQL